MVMQSTETTNGCTKSGTQTVGDRPQSPTRQRWRWLGLYDKTLWDLMSLLGAPLLIAVFGIGLTTQIEESQRREQLRREQATLDQAMQEKRNAQIVADRTAKQNALSAYLNSMTSMIKDGLGQQADTKKLTTAAISRTIVSLKELNAEQNAVVINFLKQANLIDLVPDDEAKNAERDDRCLKQKQKQPECVEPLVQRPIQLSQANLSNVDFAALDLSRVNFAQTDLRGSNLSKANLIQANLENTKLVGANLAGANLTRANLNGADVSPEELLKARLCHTIMPDGTTKNDHCSTKPFPNSRYTVATASDGTVSYFLPAEQGNYTASSLPNGTVVTLTGEHVPFQGDLWVKIKDEGRLGGWVKMEHLVAE